ncbi:hypothetical protein ENKNEFLB_03988 [Nocardioides aquaticus]|uniref:MFS transporter n=1 Tax=Nocardioides aquaticus TaxID=160826 RepID=A0ABX8EQC8_9ACTN|nr:hypothetical protein [Nocardioides aquaticus]QVT81578.1 hypothetical protein ENKNEFLB_03988 [Nocardioides aquaticus]
MVTSDALRASVLGLVCGLGAVLAHAGAAGHAVGTGPALLLTALGLVCGPLLARRPTPARVLTGALTVQAAGHGLLSMTSSPAATHDGMTGMTGMTGHGGQGGHGGHGLLDGGVTMLGGHLLVALLTTLLALRADHAIRALVRATLARLVPPPAPGAPRPVVRHPQPAPVVRRPSAPDASAAAGPRAPPGTPAPATIPHHTPQPA